MFMLYLSEKLIQSCMHVFATKHKADTSPLARARTATAFHVVGYESESYFLIDGIKIFADVSASFASGS